MVSFPDGFERILSVTGGEITSPDPTDEVSARPEGGATVVEINGVERIEVPGAACLRADGDGLGPRSAPGRGSRCRRSRA